MNGSKREREEKIASKTMQSNDDTMATTPRQSKRLFCLSFETVRGETKRKNNNTNKSSKFIFKHTIKTSIVMRKQNKKINTQSKIGRFYKMASPNNFFTLPILCIHSNIIIIVIFSLALFLSLRSFLVAVDVVAGIVRSDYRN